MYNIHQYLYTCVDLCTQVRMYAHLVFRRVSSWLFDRLACALLVCTGVGCSQSQIHTRRHVSEITRCWWRQPVFVPPRDPVHLYNIHIHMYMYMYINSLSQFSRLGIHMFCVYVYMLCMGRGGGGCLCYWIGFLFYTLSVSVLHTCIFMYAQYYTAHEAHILCITCTCTYMRIHTHSTNIITLLDLLTWTYTRAYLHVHVYSDYVISSLNVHII